MDTARDGGLAPRLRHRAWAWLRAWLLLDEPAAAGAEHWQLSVCKIIVSSSLLLCLLIAVHSLVTAWSLGVYSVIVIVVGYYIALIATLQLVRTRPRTVATLLLLMIYACGLLILLGVGDRSLSELGVVFLYVAPPLAWVYFGVRRALALMALNGVAFLYILYDQRPLAPLGFDALMPDSHRYLHALLFLFFNISVPLALFRVFAALGAGAERNRRIGERLQRSLELYENVFEHAGNPTLICAGDSRILKANQQAVRLLGRPLADTGAAVFLDALLAPANPELPLAGLLQRAFARGDAAAEYLICARQREVLLSARPIGADCLLLGIRDLSPLRRMQRELRARDHQMAHDRLTSLPNIDQLGRQWPGLLASGIRDRAPPAIASIRLNNLRSINEKIGQHGGDRLIRRFAHQLALQRQPGLEAFRLRGPLFLLLATGYGTPQQLRDGLAAFLQALPRHYAIDGASIDLDISAGFAIAQADDVGVDAPLHRSERALEAARRAHRPEPVSFDELSLSDIHRAAEIELALSGCVQRAELGLVYQPKVDVDGAICGLEALLRWRSAELGPVAPADFIPVAERTGKIHALSAFVIEQACRQQRAWLDAHGDSWPLAINLSGLDLQREGLAAQLLDAVQRHGLPVTLLDLEITETGLIENNAVALRNLQALMAAGFRIAIDDFGSGYSSLKKLSEYAIDTIKIDRSFVAAIGSNPRSERIIQLILSLARVAACEVVAEGVETAPQLEFLLASGCRKFQGYLFYRPLPAGAIDDLLAGARR